MTRPLASLSLLMALAMVLAACSSASDDTNIVGFDDDAVVTPAAVSQSADQGTDVPDDASDPANDDRGDCARSGIVDLWPGLESAVSAEIAAVVRSRTDGLAAPHPETCDRLEKVAELLVAADVGAAATLSLEQADPYVRYDLFVYESGEAAEAAMARDVVRAELPGLLPTGSGTQVSKIGQTLFVARSFTDDGTGASTEALAVLDHYSALIAGAE